MEELIELLYEDLKIELEDEETFSEAKLRSKIKNAISEVKALRNYPSGYTSTMISYDVERFYSTIRGVALFDYNQIGAEFEKTHNENGISRVYTDRNTLFKGVIPIAVV